MTQPSLYEQFQAFTVVQKQKFVEWFNGSDIDTNIWRKNNVTGTATFAMVDAIDEGYSIVTGATNGNQHNIDFNNIRPISNTSSTIIVTARIVTTTNAEGSYGLLNNIASGIGIDDASMFWSNIGTNNYKLLTADASADVFVDSGLAGDNSWHTHKIILRPSSSTLTIDGGNIATSTTHLPSQKLQPCMWIYTNANSSMESRIKYLEVFNQ